MNQNHIKIPEPTFIKKDKICEYESIRQQKPKTKIHFVTKNNEIKSNFFKVDKPYEFDCEHGGCDLKFKTIKQKYMHHNKLEPECKTDKNEIIKMIGLYKKKIFKMLSGKVDKLKSVLKTDVDFINLKTLYEKCESITMDSDFFKSAVGEEFDTLPS